MLSSLKSTEEGVAAATKTDAASRDDELVEEEQGDTENEALLQTYEPTLCTHAASRVMAYDCYVCSDLDGWSTNRIVNTGGHTNNNNKNEASSTGPAAPGARATNEDPCKQFDDNDESLVGSNITYYGRLQGVQADESCIVLFDNKGKILERQVEKNQVLEENMFGTSRRGCYDKVKHYNQDGREFQGCICKSEKCNANGAQALSSLLQLVLPDARQYPAAATAPINQRGPGPVILATAGVA
ncbi:unnamed protein product [Notodromas monacha]|uniref:Uncharacterized protein n=1 Tax=Notodromas monacha TaxID=399045 RepID=A0A7R9BM31_9CRUS|nr:unnamed protein product [Notodromas monacha]CAG0916678.1 unnamed protein product [Notodromas monacha]